MMDNVWKRISNKRPKGAKLFKWIGLGSAIIWILALTCMFTFRNHALPKGVMDAAQAGVDSVKAHGGTFGVAKESAVPGEWQAEAHSEAQVTGSEKPPSTGETQGEEAKPTAAKAKLTVDMPTRAEWAALKQLAELYDQTGELEKAVPPLRRVMVMPTRDADLLTLATRVFLGTANYAEALENARQALALRPKDIGLKVRAIECQYRLGNVEKALTESAAALKEQPEDLNLLLEQATMEIELGPGHEGYGTALKAALKLKPAWVPALYLSGRKAQLEGNFRDAETLFRKVLAVESANAKAHAQLGMALYHQGKISESVPEFQRALALSPRDYNTWFNLGEAQLNQAEQAMAPGKIQVARAAAMESYLQALELYPDLAQANFRVGVLLNGNGQYKEAIRHLQAALKIDSHHVPTLIQLSLAYESLKQPDRAREYLSKAYELDPFNKVVLFRLKRWS